MCPTKYSLVKSNSVATLNPTWARFVMVTQKLITYCCKNIHPQVHLIIQYTPYAYSAITLIHSVNVYTYIIHKAKIITVTYCFRQRDFPRIHWQSRIIMFTYFYIGGQHPNVS
jgi:hypothetical protein